MPEQTRPVRRSMLAAREENGAILLRVFDPATGTIDDDVPIADHFELPLGPEQSQAVQEELARSSAGKAKAKAADAARIAALEAAVASVTEALPAHGASVDTVQREVIALRELTEKAAARVATLEAANAELSSRVAVLETRLAGAERDLTNVIAERPAISALDRLTAAVREPKRIVRDGEGEVAGMEPGSPHAA